MIFNTSESLLKNFDFFAALFLHLLIKVKEPYPHN